MEWLAVGWLALGVLLTLWVMNSIKEFEVRGYNNVGLWWRFSLPLSLVTGGWRLDISDKLLSWGRNSEDTTEAAVLVNFLFSPLFYFGSWAVIAIIVLIYSLLFFFSWLGGLLNNIPCPF